MTTCNQERARALAPSPSEAARVDVDIQIPIGESLSFGREDTVQELTESSVKEFDEMVLPVGESGSRRGDTSCCEIYNVWVLTVFWAHGLVVFSF